MVKIILYKCRSFFAPVAQLDRVHDYESWGQRFESSLVYQLNQAASVQQSSLFNI